MAQREYGSRTASDPIALLLCEEVSPPRIIRVEGSHSNEARDDGVGVDGAPPGLRPKRAPRVIFQDEDIHFGDDSDMSISEDDCGDEATSSDDDFIASSDSSDELSYTSSVSSGYSPDKESLDEESGTGLSAEEKEPAEEDFGEVLTDQDCNASGVSSSSLATRTQLNGERAGRRYRDSMNLRAILPPMAHSPPRKDDALMMGRALHAFTNGRPLPKDRSGAKAIVRLRDRGDKRRSR